MLVVTAFVRRGQRERYFQRSDALRDRYSPILKELAAGGTEYSACLGALRDLPAPNRELVVETFLVKEKPGPAESQHLSRLCEELGLVQTWQQHLGGKNHPGSAPQQMSPPNGASASHGLFHFLERARSARNLGLVRHRPSWRLLVSALDDPHPDVQGVALRSLAAMQESRSVPALVKKLHSAVLGSTTGVSPCSVRAALAQFPLSEAGALLKSLQHPDARIRFHASDIIRIIAERAAAGRDDFLLPSKNFSPPMARVFLTQLSADSDPNVRGRAALVIAHMERDVALRPLLRLLRDEMWFVRLHAVRALAKSRFLPELGEISRCLFDSHWNVREAAVRTLLTFGPAGFGRLLDFLLRAENAASRDQVLEELERSGQAANLMACFENQNDSAAKPSLARLAQLVATDPSMTAKQWDSSPGAPSAQIEALEHSKHNPSSAEYPSRPEAEAGPRRPTGGPIREAA